MGVSVEFENDRVRVLRAQHSGREQHPRASRRDRLVIYLNDGSIRRTIHSEGSKKEEIHRKCGEVIWRDRSEHEIENLKDSRHEVIIVELK
jgi:hypothetical protein